MSEFLFYILDDDNNPVPLEQEDVRIWGEWFENGKKRIVRQTQVGPYVVSTVFLGIDHNFAPDGPPVLWETMVFAGERRGGGILPSDLDMRRYTSLKDAQEGHQITCDLVALTVEQQEGKMPQMSEVEK